MKIELKYSMVHSSTYDLIIARSFMQSMPDCLDIDKTITTFRLEETVFCFLIVPKCVPGLNAVSDKFLIDEKGKTDEANKSFGEEDGKVVLTLHGKKDDECSEVAE